jgi:hypothetical protein
LQFWQIDAEKLLSLFIGVNNFAPLADQDDGVGQIAQNIDERFAAVAGVFESDDLFER